MNNHEQEIENALRSAPRPAPPAGLKNGLISQVQLPMGHASSQPALDSSTFGGWLRRWWPALAPAAVSVVCAVVMTVQQQEISQLQQAIQELSAHAASSASAFAPAPPSVTSSTVPDFQSEIARLKQQSEQLKAEIAQLEKFSTENRQLKTQLTSANLPPELQEFGPALQEAQDKALRIRCVNSLKQIGLAVRIWSNDHGDTNPPSLLVLSRELGSPKILVCPADTNRPAATDWATITAANCSYEYLTPSAFEADREPNRVLSRCPIHGTVGLSDGSVQQLSPERAALVVQRDGKLFFEQPSASASGAPGMQTTQGHDVLVPLATTEQAIVNACFNNRRQLDGAKQQWALENRQTAQAVPTPQDIAPYLKNWPACPAGGQYRLNAVGDMPTCSIPGHNPINL